MLAIIEDYEMKSVLKWIVINLEKDIYDGIKIDTKIPPKDRYAIIAKFFDYEDAKLFIDLKNRV